MVQWSYRLPSIKVPHKHNGAAQQFHYRNSMLQRNVFAIPPMDCGGICGMGTKVTATVGLTAFFTEAAQR
jgi:hypothetical protein